MATLITSIGTPAFASKGERRLAKRLEQKLDADYIRLLEKTFPKVDHLANALAQRKLPLRIGKKSGVYQLRADAIQVITMKFSKGLVFPLVALPSVGHLPAAGVIRI